MKIKDGKTTDADSFIDCGEGIKEEIKIEETLDEDPLTIQIKAEENIDNKDVLIFEDERRSEVKVKKDQDLLIVDYCEAIVKEVKEELTEIKQEIKEEGIHDQDPLCVLENSTEKDMDIIDIVHHKIEIDKA